MEKQELVSVLYQVENSGVRLKYKWGKRKLNSRKAFPSSEIPEAAEWSFKELGTLVSPLVLQGDGTCSELIFAPVLY